MKIGETFHSIQVRQILTSRGLPTVEVDLHTSNGMFRSSCPSGASTGSKEAKVIVDKNMEEYNGKGVKKALFHIKTLIIPRIADIADTLITHQGKIDEFLISLDGSKNKSRLGANAILPLSQSFCRAGASFMDISLRKFVSVLSGSASRIPYPHFNILNGGAHARNNLVFQEIMISFQDNDFASNLEKGVKVYNCLKNVISEQYPDMAIGVGDEGGFAPPTNDLEEALDLVMRAYKKSTLTGMRIAIDCAASEFYTFEGYNLGRGILKSGPELIDYYKMIIDKYPDLYMLEDPFGEDDFESWKNFSKELSNKPDFRIVGDDLTVTNVKHISTAIDQKLCNTLLVKLNQVGTVSETIKAVKLARSAGMKIMVSHRSGETEDTFISDFAAGLGADYFKAGAPCRGERIAKYNQLLRIEEFQRKSK